MKKITLKIQGQEIKFVLGLGFLGVVLDKLDLDPVETQAALARNPFKMVPTLMYYSAQYSEERKGRNLAMTLIEFIDMLDESPGDFESGPMADFLTAFNLSMSKDVPEDKSVKPQVTAKGAKKKSTGKVMS